MQNLDKYYLQHYFNSIFAYICICIPLLRPCNCNEHTLNSWWAGWPSGQCSQTYKKVTGLMGLNPTQV